MVTIERMKSLFLGGHPAIDFLNTSLTPDGVPTETISDGRSFLDWLVGARLLEEQEAARLVRRFGTKALDSAAAEARKVREWARAWLVRWRERPGANYHEEIATLNKLLARESRWQQVVVTPQGLRLVEKPEIDDADTLVALVATQIAALLANEESSLIRACAGPGCSLWFVDRTKAHRRLFCSAALCGNRAKVAAFRSRQRQ
jgi:predicted RNA-binding Zn ribbon-like protein